MKNKEYWLERERQKLKRQDADIEELEKYLLKQYKKANKDIEKEISYLFNKYAGENGLTYYEAIKLLNSKEFKDFRYDLRTYLELIEYTADEKLLLELNTLAMRSRINRLENLLFQVNKIIDKLTNTINTKVGEVLEKEIIESYSKSIYNTQKFLGIGFTFAKISNEVIKDTLLLPWSGANYSERVWKNRDKLKYIIKENIIQMLIQGNGVEETSREFTKRTQNLFQQNYKCILSHYKSSVRLIRTEYAYVSEQGTVKSYGEMNVEKYEYLATLDKRTSEKCQSLDTKVFYVKNASVGENYPPMHPNCRSTTIPYIDTKLTERVARDKKGKTINIEKMSYDEWYKKYAK